MDANAHPQVGGNPYAMILTLKEIYALLGVKSLPKFIAEHQGDGSNIQPKTLERALQEKKVKTPPDLVKEAIKVASVDLMSSITGLEKKPRIAELSQRVSAILNRETALFRDSPNNDLRIYKRYRDLPPQEALDAGFLEVIKTNLTLLAGFDASIVLMAPSGQPSLFAGLFPRHESATNGPLRLPMWWWLTEIKAVVGMRREAYSGAFATFLNVPPAQPNRWMKAASPSHLPKWSTLMGIRRRLERHLTGSPEMNLIPSLMLSGMAARALHMIALGCAYHGIPKAEVLGLHPWYLDTFHDWLVFYRESLEEGEPARQSPIATLHRAGSA